MPSQISILGIGWLGFPLAKALIQDGYSVKGSTTTNTKLIELKTVGIDAYQILLEEARIVGEIVSFLKESEILLINIPPGLRRNPNSNFVAKIAHLLPYIKYSSIQKVLFVSSTSVFEATSPFTYIMDEMPANASSLAGLQLIACEKLLQAADFRTTILRFSGLFNDARHPSSTLSKRKGIKHPDAPVNLIHLTDCIGIIQTIIKGAYWGSTFNAAYPSHPSKSDYYTKICQQKALPAPDFDYTNPSKGKIIVSDGIEKQLAYHFSTGLY